MLDGKEISTPEGKSHKAIPEAQGETEIYEETNLGFHIDLEITGRAR